MKDLREKLAQLVNESIDYIFIQGHTIAETKSGDITPCQVILLNKIEKELTDLLFDQIKQNLDND